MLLNSIEDTLLLQEKDFETQDGHRPPMDVAEFYYYLETKRMARLDGLVQQYNSIESLLIKVLVSDVTKYDTNHTPKSPEIHARLTLSRYKPSVQLTDDD